MASAIEGRFKSRIDKSTVSLNGEVRTAADVEDRLLSDIHILSLSLPSSLPLLSLAYVRSCTRAYACRRLWNEFAMFLHARFLSSSSAVLSLSPFRVARLYTLDFAFRRSARKLLRNGSRVRECRCMFSESSAITEQRWRRWRWRRRVEEPWSAAMPAEGTTEKPKERAANKTRCESHLLFSRSIVVCVQLGLSQIHDQARTVRMCECLRQRHRAT